MTIDSTETAANQASIRMLGVRVADGDLRKNGSIDHPQPIGTRNRQLMVDDRTEAARSHGVIKGLSIAAHRAAGSPAPSFGPRQQLPPNQLGQRWLSPSDAPSTRLNGPIEIDSVAQVIRLDFRRHIGPRRDQPQIA